MRKRLENPEEVEIRAEWFERLEALPVVQGGNPGIQWTDEMDAVLLRYWNSGKKQRDIAAILNVSQGVCRDRYRKLTGQKA